jgi:2,5-diamino-6-(ribosylamino)-4(3H)-pyrimidinone 5'-phosphate reductase
MLPRVILHNAVSVDGRIDWFTADIGLFYELAQQWKEDATLVGCDTLLNAPDEIPDEGDMDVHPPEVEPDDSRPILIVPDSHGRLRSWHYWLSQPYWKCAVALCSTRTPEEYLQYLDQRHIKYLIAGDDHVDYRTALEELNSRFGIKCVRVDSGGTLNGVLLRDGLVSEISLLLHPGLVGGVTPMSFFRAPDLESASGVVNLKLLHMEKVRDNIVWLKYEVVK